PFPEMLPLMISGTPTGASTAPNELVVMLRFSVRAVVPVYCSPIPVGEAALVGMPKTIGRPGVPRLLSEENWSTPPWMARALPVVVPNVLVPVRATVPGPNFVSPAEVVMLLGTVSTVLAVVKTTPSALFAPPAPNDSVLPVFPTVVAAPVVTASAPDPMFRLNAPVTLPEVTISELIWRLPVRVAAAVVRMFENGLLGASGLVSHSVAVLSGRMPLAP